MRPLTLRMSGLRSYRSEVTIDFGDPGLIAIVGDTGAGKSSILEALFFVLYGGCTWDHRAAVPLISDGVTVMQVELVFLAEGRRWRVFRSASRTSSQKRHELECLDDTSIRFDNDVPVSNEIKRLIGLDPDAFLRTVILPQGRFQLLLQATRTDRTAILKGIFRLDQLAAARDQAERAARRLRPGVDDLKFKRAALPADPAADLADARERHDQARSRLARIQDLAEKITTAASQREDADRRAADLGARERLVRDTRIPTAGADLADLAATAVQLEEHRRHLHAGRERHRREADSLAGLLRKAADDGEGLEQLAGAASSLIFLDEQLPHLAREAAGCEEQTRELEALAERLQDQDAAAASLRARSLQAEAEATRLDAAATAASENVSQARARLASARSRAATFADYRSAMESASDRQAQAVEAIDPAADRARAAADERDRAGAALEAIKRAHAAAHAAEGCQPGDECPICQRPLPTDFAMPQPAGEAEARAAQRAAERAAEQSATTLAAREAELSAASDEAERAGQAAREAETELAAAVAQLQLILPGADLETDDEAVLTPLTVKSLSAKAEYDAQTTEASRLGQQAATATATADALRAQRQQQEGQLRRRQDALDAQRAAFENAIAGLPASYRVPIPVTAEALAAASGLAAARRDELSEINDRLSAARAVIDEISGDLETLADQVRERVDEPARQLIPRLTAAAERLNDLAALLGLSPAPARPGGSLADDAEWADQLNTAADAALAQAQASGAELRRLGEQALTTMTAALATVGVDDERGLHQVIITVSSVLNRAADDIQVATEQIPQVAELATKIKQGRDLLEALDELTRVLADGKFIAYVVVRKQQALLAIAAEVLGSMTGNRYGFSETFEIVDRLTGLPRGVKTLSGGETFLASLALALGLVELAGRGGGRLDALFLDEGFGSLDANSLTEALEALGRQAETGRLVAVISHLRSVAEAMDRVLAVTTGPAGSQAHWLGGDEREELIAEDVEAGLLT